MAKEDKTTPQNVDVVRAWKDEEYRNSLTPEQLAQLPSNPVGEGELSEDDLGDVNGGELSLRCIPSRNSGNW